MKKVSLIFNIVLSVAIVALFVLHFSDKSCSTKSANSEIAGETAVKGDIVYIQIDTLVNQYDMFNDLRSELETEVTAIQNDLGKKSRAFENDAKDFEDKMAKGLLTRSQAENTQNSLLKRQQELQAYSQQKQMEMAEKENVLFNKVMDAIKTYINKYNEDHKYALILTSSTSTNAVISSNEALNITQDVLDGLNSEYIKNRNKR